MFEGMKGKLPASMRYPNADLKPFIEVCIRLPNGHVFAMHGLKWKPGTTPIGQLMPGEG